MKYAVIMIFVFVFTQGTWAMECGQPPLDLPAVPSVSGLTSDALRQARERVISYSEGVDRYLTCMDRRAAMLFTYMTEEQRTRWQDDLADVHNGRRELQVEMNALIRAFRKATPSEN